MARKKVLVRNPFGNQRTRRQLAAAAAVAAAATDPPSSTPQTTVATAGEAIAPPPSSPEPVATTAASISATTGPPPTTGYVVHYEETHAVVTRVVPSETLASTIPPITTTINPTVTTTIFTQTINAPIPQTTTTTESIITTINTTTHPSSTILPDILNTNRTLSSTTLQNPQPRLNAAGDYRNPLYGPPNNQPNPEAEDLGTKSQTPKNTTAPTHSSDDASTSSASTETTPEKTPEKRPATPSESDRDYQPESTEGSKRKKGKSITPSSRKRARTSRPSATPKSRSASKKSVERYTTPTASKLLMERSFDPQLISTYAHIPHHLLAYQWGDSIPYPAKANASWLREFYSAISGSSATSVVIRGRKVNFSPMSLSKTFGMAVPAVCNFANLLESLTLETSLDIARALMIPKYVPTFDPSKFSIPSGTLNMEASLWFSFLRHNLMPTTHDATLSKEKCVLLYCILNEYKFNFGQIAFDALKVATSRSGSWMIFPVLLTKLMQAAKVPSRPSDEMCTSLSRIDQGTVQRFLRSGRFIAGESVGPSSSIPGTTAADKRAGSSAKLPADAPGVMYGNEEWLMVLAQQREETNMLLTSMKDQLTAMQAQLTQVHGQQQEQLDRIAGLEASSSRFWAYQRDWNRVVRSFYFKNDPVRAATFPRFPSGLCPPQMIIPTTAAAGTTADVPPSTSAKVATEVATTVATTTVATTICSDTTPAAQVSGP